MNNPLQENCGVVQLPLVLNILFNHIAISKYDETMIYHAPVASLIFLLLAGMDTMIAFRPSVVRFGNQYGFTLQK